MTQPQQRTPEEIRASIERNRQELSRAVGELSTGVSQATDWRLQVQRHPKEIAGAVAGVGFLLGGGIVALGGLLGGGR